MFRNIMMILWLITITIMGYYTSSISKKLDEREFIVIEGEPCNVDCEQGCGR